MFAVILSLGIVGYLVKISYGMEWAKSLSCGTNILQILDTHRGNSYSLVHYGCFYQALPIDVVHRMIGCETPEDSSCRVQR